VPSAAATPNASTAPAETSKAPATAPPTPAKAPVEETREPAAAATPEAPPLEPTAETNEPGEQNDAQLTVSSRARSAARAPKTLSEGDPIQTAMMPFLPRMRRLNLSTEMLRSRLRNGAEFNEDDIALDWVGMPNKNERKLISDLCAAFAEAGLLRANGERQWIAELPAAN
jgi:hypothetical protein